MVIKYLDVATQPSKGLNTGTTVVLLLLISLAGCRQFQSGKKKSSPSPATSSIIAPADDGFIHQLAQVESVAVQVSPLDPTKADISISGLLNDGATQVQDIQEQKLADGFVITVTTVRPKNAMASLALIPFDRKITVSLNAMPKGLCKVVVNGVATTFTIL